MFFFEEQGNQRGAGKDGNLSDGERGFTAQIAAALDMKVGVDGYAPVFTNDC